MNYTRKRALLACDFCRHRKRRCDGERPCSTCRESNADCRYKDLPIERVESPSTSSEVLVERLGRIEALLEEQGQQLQNLFHGSGIEGSHLSISPKVSIDAAAEVSEAADAGNTPSAGPPSSHFSRSSLHLAPEAAVATVAGTPGSSATSPSAPAPSPIGVNPLLGLDATPQQAFFHQESSIPYHTASTGSAATAAVTAAAAPSNSSPIFGYSASTSFFSGLGLTPGGTRSLLTGKASSVAASDVSSHNIEQEQFLIPYEHSTAANTLLSLPLVRFFLDKKINSSHTEGDGADGGEGSASYSFCYPRTYFFDIETNQSLPPQLDLIYGPGLVPAIWPPPVLASSHPAVLDGLVRNYFAYVHPNAPLFSSAKFVRWSTKLYEMGPDDSIETAICLTVWALGSLAAPSGSSAAAAVHQAERDRVALSLFQPAFKIILHHTLWEFGPASLTICQALLLAASYFSHIGRPLHNARMVHLAGRQLLRLIEEHKRDGLEPELDGQLLPVFWVCFIWECDRAAELDIPRSGVEPLADRMPLPSSLDPDDGDDMICFVAEIAARRLLNRIHSSLYATPGGNDLGPIMLDNSDSASGRTTPGNKRKRAESELYATTYGVNTGISASGSGSGSSLDNSSINKMLPVSAELNRQLEAWYSAIPDHMRPPLSTVPAVGAERGAGDYPGDDYDDDGEGGASDVDLRHDRTTNTTIGERIKILRIHYYAARHIIHRPFVLSVAWQQQQQIMARDGAVDELKSAPPPPGAPGVASLASSAPPPLPTAVLEKCAMCVDSCAAYLVHVLPLLERRSPYLWSFCQSSMACLLVLLLADACPGIASNRSLAGRRRARTINIGRLRDQVANRLRRWAAPGSSFEAELHIVENLPVSQRQRGRLNETEDDAWRYVKQETD